MPRLTQLAFDYNGFDHVQRRAINTTVRKSELIQVKGSKKVDNISSSRFVDVGDKLKWRLNRSRFHVCSYYKAIQQSKEPWQLLSIGRVIGVLRIQREFLFLFGQQHEDSYL